MRKVCNYISALFAALVFFLPHAYFGQQIVTSIPPAPGVNLNLPNRAGSVRMLVFGDAGRGSKDQYELAALMDRYHQTFNYDTVLMTGDNIYYEDTPADMKKKFEEPYKALLDKGVQFYASLGNHDSPNQRLYALFNMNGEEYYRIEKGGVAIYALNSVYMDKRQ
ncbi:MAG: metallophosphoesterase, partial [bacterium]|nr:metallophosphoesterase [bacterium]